MMKYINLITGALSVSSAVAIASPTFYVSSSTGKDSNPGTQALPWKTIAKVNGQTFAAGTSVLFKRGDKWDRSAGPSVIGTFLPIGGGTQPIIYDAYGTGANPIIDGSADASTTAAWTNIGPRLWQSVQTFAPFYTESNCNGGALSNGCPYWYANDVGNILWGFAPLGGSAPPAVMRAAFGRMQGQGTGGIWFVSGEGTSSLHTQGDWNFNTDNWRVQVFSAHNPATDMPGLRLVMDGSCAKFESTNNNYIIQNFTFQNMGASNCFEIRNTSLTIRSNVIQWVGGGNIGGRSNDGSRAGDGANLKEVYNTILFERNYFYEMYDLGISPQLSNPGAHANLTIRNNVFQNLTLMLGDNVAPGTGSSTQKGLYVFNNTMFGGVGGSWSQNQRPNGGPAVWGMRFQFDPTVVTTYTKIDNNVFSGLGDFGMINDPSPNPTVSLSSMAPITFDHNLWALLSLPRATLFDSLGLPNSTIAAWASANFRERHGLIDLDPQFTNQGGNDFTPATGSRLRNAGVNLFSSGVVVDFNGNPRPTTGPFTIGAFQ